MQEAGSPQRVVCIPLLPEKRKQATVAPSQPPQRSCKGKLRTVSMFPKLLSHEVAVLRQPWSRKLLSSPSITIPPFLITGPSKIFLN
eukprot:4017018-Amphidinium_carterae.1